MPTGTVIRDIIFANIREPELQRRVYKMLQAPKEVLRVVQAYERGVADQSKLKWLKAGRNIPLSRNKECEHEART